MTPKKVPVPPALAQLTAPQEAGPAVRSELADCWTAVLNSGGAVVASALPMPPVGRATVRAEVERLAGRLSPERLRMLVARVDGTLAGWLLLLRDEHPLVAHVGVVHHVQSHPEHRGTGIGGALMRYAARVAREEMRLERLHLSARSGLGLESFYSRLGWKEIGRWPQALRVSPGDDRDDILMHLAL
ncbi:GNAT family N-acetyltransferase [Actinacidiphila alni]|uniref:GNAT family N-acetyltransferase n=1 Tax=Actinacidiphila alni TaxID=380248 RepID=UPI0033D61760